MTGLSLMLMTMSVAGSPSLVGWLLPYPKNRKSPKVTQILKIFNLD